MRARVWGLGTGLMLFIGAAISATATLPPGAVLIDGATAKSDSARLAIETATLLGRLERGDDAGALARLQKISDPLAFELTAARVIEGLSMTSKGDALLAALETVPTRVFRRHEETMADWFMPAFDIAGQAKSLREMRARRQRAAALRADLLADPAAATKRDGEWPQAIAMLSPQEVERVAEAIVGQRAHADPGAVVALAARSKRADLWDLALDTGAPVDVMPLFRQVDAQLSPDAAKAWVTRAARDPRYASAAVLASARLPDDALHAWLDDATLGPSAAAALAQRDGDAFVGQVDALAGAKASGQRLRHVALALRLIGTPAALAKLQRLAQDPRLPAHVRTELQR